MALKEAGPISNLIGADASHNYASYKNTFCSVWDEQENAVRIKMAEEQ